MNQIDPPLSSRAAADAPEPSARLLSDLFFSRAESSPDSVAAIFGERALTYRQMADQVEAMARGLVASGVRPGQFVGLWMTRSLDLQMALLAILRAGAAYLPFDQAAPADRVAVCLKDAEAVALLVDHSTQNLAAGLPLPVLSAAGLVRADGPLPDLALVRHLVTHTLAVIRNHVGFQRVFAELQRLRGFERGNQPLIAVWKRCVPVV